MSKNVNKNGALTSQELHPHHLVFSQSMAKEIKKSIADAYASIEPMDIKKSVDRKVLFAEVNVFLRDINDVIFNLRVLMFRFDEASHSRNGLISVIHQLGDISENVRGGFKNLNECKGKLKNAVKVIENVSQNLLTIIEECQDHEFQQELVDMLNDLLSAIDRVKLRNEIRASTKEVVESNLVNAKNDVLKTVRSFRTHNETVLRCLIHHMLRGCQHMVKVVQHLQKYGGNFDAEVAHAIDFEANSLHDLLTALLMSLRTCNTVESIAAQFEEGLRNGYDGLIDLVKFLDDQYGTGHHNLKETVFFTTIETFVNGSQLHRGLLDAIRIMDSMNE